MPSPDLRFDFRDFVPATSQSSRCSFSFLADLGECPAVPVQNSVLAADLLPALHDNIDVLGIELDAVADPLGEFTEARSQQAQAELKLDQARDQSLESKAKVGQAMHVVDTLDILESQRPGVAAKVQRARLDLERSRVVAPFDAYVTNLNISEGAYAHAGSPMFTLIDARTWWVIANYREGKIRNIHVGSKVDVYLMGHPDRKFDGVVQSVGYGVFPEDGKVSDGLPNIERTLNWVHLSTRFPVRILIQNPDPTLFRIGATALTIVR
jgi:multidrug efflux system membrane fusion protein